MTQASTKKALPFAEFVALMALLISLVALSIDAMLPALPDIGRDLLVPDINDTQLIVSMIFLGMAFGQLFYGPLSDSIGRKPAVFLGIGIFILGCLVSIFAPDFRAMLLGRVLQGIGLGAPRIVSIALIRDQYEGHAMARVMSFVMMVFIVVPMIAPALGQGILMVAEWRAIFWVIMGLGLIILCWFMIRQPETLPPGQRVPFSLTQMGRAVREILTNRVALGYTLGAGWISSAFLGYLSTVQQVFQQQYGLGELFPLVFAGLALAVGIASFVNGRLVMRVGMQGMCKRSLQILSLASLVFYVVSYFFSGHPSLWLLVIYLLVTLFCMGILFGNINALAMEPLGHIAGIGAAVVGSLSTLISVPLGIAIARAYDGSILPIVGGFACCGLITLLTMSWTEAGRLDDELLNKKE